jgi:hypothetical protein
MVHKLMNQMLEMIVLDLESTANWRFQKSQEHPGDPRNERASDLLERLAREIEASPDLTIVDELSKNESELIRLSEKKRGYDFSSLIEECNYYRKRIGFSEFPASGNEYLQYLLAIYNDEVTRAKENSWSDYGLPEDSFSIFKESYHHTRDILAGYGGDNGSYLINRMVFTQQVTALEAYLCDTLANAVMNDKNAMDGLLEGDKETGKPKSFAFRDRGEATSCSRSGPQLPPIDLIS